MSEIDDLMVDVMMRGDDDATNATVRLIQMARDGEIPQKQKRQLLKAVERRVAKEKSGTELHEFLITLAEMLDPNAKPQTSELPAGMESPDAALARKMRGDNRLASYEVDDVDQSDVHPTDRIIRDRTSGMDDHDKANFVHPKDRKDKSVPPQDDLDAYLKPNKPKKKKPGSAYYDDNDEL